MRGGAAEKKIVSNLGVAGSNPNNDCSVCKFFRTAKTVASYVWIPTKTDQNDKKNVLISFDEVKPTKNDDFLG